MGEPSNKAKSKKTHSTKVEIFRKWLNSAQRYAEKNKYPAKWWWREADR